jgi:hypothetical protein
MEYKEAMRNIDDGERIGAFDDQTIVIRQQAEHLASPRLRQGTVQTTQIDNEEHPNLTAGGALHLA